MRRRVPPSACDDLTETCGPSAAQAPGFLTCIFQSGVNSCEAPYSTRYVVYKSFDDQRGCACTCSPSGASCTATLNVSEMGGCSKPFVVSLELSDGGTSCADLPNAGLPLGSK